MTNVEIISASAGTGKTYTLAELLLDAIKTGAARPEAIVATTFTNKAAAELRERVRRRLLAAGLVDEARRLGAARIGTVNGICGQLVGEFAFELGLPPDLRVLDETEAEMELRRALSSVLGGGRALELVELKGRMDCLEWEKDVEKVIGRARENHVEPDALRACGARSIVTFDELLCPPADEVSAEELSGELRAAIMTFLDRLSSLGDTTKTTAKVVDECKAALNSLDHSGTLSWHQWQSLTGAGPGAKSREAFDPVRTIAARHARSAGLRADCHAAINAVFGLAADALDAYAGHKANMGAIDFVDQEVFALEVLRSPALTARLSGSIDLVLVDEFQDTSPIQLAIFLALAELAPRNVWVGDQKQAIFGFRGTDPALMDAAIEALLGGTEPKTLDVSYRSRRELVALTSDVFVEPFAARGIPEARVRIGANDDGGNSDLDPCVEIWQLQSKNNTDDVAALAEGVRELVESGSFRIRDAANHGSSRAARAGDVAVLCRTNVVCVALAAELARLGLRASVERAGLFTTPEARVLMAGLRLWADSSDKLARAEIARLVEYPEDASAWLAAALGASGESDVGAVAEVCQLENARTRDPLAGALDAFDLTVEALGLRDLCRSWGDSDERIANVDAVRSLAVQYSDIAAREGRAATPWGLNAFLEEVAEQELDTRPAFEGADAVTVSTWHRAKGLEWPIVVLLDNEPERNASPLGVHVASDRAAIQLSDPLEGRWVRYWPNPYHSSQTKSEFHERVAGHDAAARAAEAAERENLRVAYVGWTRARDCVVLAARPGKASDGLLARLSGPETTLSIPAIAEDDEFVTLEWGADPVRARVRRCAPANAREREVEVGSTYVASGPREHPPRWIQPSGDGAAPLGGDAPVVVGEPEVIGSRVALSGEPRMDDVGHAIHGFLAADHTGLDPAERLGMAAGLLARWEVADVLAPVALIAAGDALRSWVEARWPGAVWHRELPLLHRLASGCTVRGSCDLALETADGWVVIDHKSFPGSTEDALARAQTHAPQLAAYAAAIRRATGRPVLGCWIHLPVAGQVVEVSC